MLACIGHLVAATALFFGAALQFKMLGAAFMNQTLTIVCLLSFLVGAAANLVAAWKSYQRRPQAEEGEPDGKGLEASK